MLNLIKNYRSNKQLSKYLKSIPIAIDVTQYQIDTHRKIIKFGFDFKVNAINQLRIEMLITKVHSDVFTINYN